MSNDASGYRQWPCYDVIRKAKINLHPEYTVNDEGTLAVVDLQSMINHTLGRIMLDEDVWEMITRDSFLLDGVLVLVFYVKIGQDGTSYYSMLKQGPYIGQDRFWMGTWFCGLQLVGQTNGRPYYTNNLALSAQSCRPLRLANERETPAINKAEFSRIKDEIQALRPWKFSSRVTIQFKVWNSMNDQKEVLDMVDVSGATKCPVCSKCHSQWILCYDDNGDFDENHCDEPIELNEVVFEELAASITHYGINSFKHLYELSIRMHLSHQKGYNISWELERGLVKARKTCLQDRFKNINVLLDFMTNTGSTMTGNAARTAYANAEFTAENFEIHLDIVQGFHNVWIALRAPFKILPDKFKSYCKWLRLRYYELYPWAELNVSVHKILDHGHLFLRHVPDTLTLSVFSEENLEASHKVLRDHLLNHARGFSRKDRLQDVIQRKLDMSDPVILAPAMDKHPSFTDGKPFPAAVLAMAYVPPVPESGDAMDTS